MLLAFDVGNTNIVLGLYKEGKLVANWRLTTDKNKTADELGITVVSLFKYENFDIKEVKDVIISSVVPQIMYSLQHMAQKYCDKEAIVIGPGIRTGLNIKYDNPKLVGADRIVNAVAAMKKYGGAVIIVDFGTATTFCAITEKSEYLGGAILPGVKISSDALYEKTAKLPRVELVKPESVIAKNTIQSIQSGLIYGYAGAVERLVSKMKAEIISEKPVRVIATGGLASLIATEAESIDIVDKNLTLDGLYYIYEMNRS